MQSLSSRICIPRTIGSSVPALLDSTKTPSPIKIKDVGQCIGEGGFGQVREVATEAFEFQGQTVTQAVLKRVDLRPNNRRTKQPNGGISTGSLSNFRNEFLAGKFFTSEAPNVHIVKTYGMSVDISNKCAYLLIEKIDGKDLHKSFHGEKHERTPIDQLDKELMAAQTILAVSHMHQHQWLYGDIKLENTIWNARTKTITLIDLGFARKLQHDVVLKDVKGTESYLAPEIGRKPYRFEVDVWALGVLVYEIFSGHEFSEDMAFEARKWQGRGERMHMLKLSDSREDAMNIDQFVSDLLTPDQKARPAMNDGNQPVLSHFSVTDWMAAYVEHAIEEPLDGSVFSTWFEAHFEHVIKKAVKDLAKTHKKYTNNRHKNLETINLFVTFLGNFPEAKNLISVVIAAEECAEFIVRNSQTTLRGWVTRTASAMTQQLKILQENLRKCSAQEPPMLLQGVADALDPYIKKLALEYKECGHQKMKEALLEKFITDVKQDVAATDVKQGVAATNIQSQYRSYKARQELVRAVAAATNIQSRYRSYKTRKVPLGKQTEKAAATATTIETVSLNSSELTCVLM